MARPLPELPGVRHRDVDSGRVRLHVAEAGQRDGDLAGYEEYAPEMTAEILPGVGHFPAEEAPNAVVDRLVAFLE